MARRTLWRLAAGGAAAGLAAAAAWGTETVTYSYDAKGRLVKVERKDDVSNEVTVGYKHDKADNRTKVKVTGSANPAPP